MDYTDEKDDLLRRVFELEDEREAARELLIELLADYNSSSPSLFNSSRIAFKLGKLLKVNSRGRTS